MIKNCKYASNWKNKYFLYFAIFYAKTDEKEADVKIINTLIDHGIIYVINNNFVINLIHVFVNTNNHAMLTHVLQRMSKQDLEFKSTIHNEYYQEPN